MSWNYWKRLSKMPPLLRELARSPEALAFLRKASRVWQAEEMWRRLSDPLDTQLGAGDETDARAGE